MMLFRFVMVALFLTPITGDSCESYIHPQHGKTGRCIKTSDCPGAFYVSNLCESKPNNIKCCFTSTTSPDGCPTIVSRIDWKARTAKSKTVLTTPVPFIVIHHTAGPSCTNKQACISRVQLIQKFHMDTKGWDDIGYNFVVSEDGNVYEGRGWTLVGAHCIGYNSKSIGISVMGDYTSRLPSDAALNAVKTLIKCGVSRGYIQSNYTLRGHRDLYNTACPGNVLYAEIQRWKNFRSVRSFSVPEDYIVMQDM